MVLTTEQLDRAHGVLVAAAAGDALGAPYEFGGPRGPELAVEMVGGGTFDWAPGEWTDDTAMAIAIAEVAATQTDLRDDDAQDEIVTRWVEWSRSAKDIGNQTRAVLAAVTTDGPGAAATARAAAAELHERTGHTGGNGSLMRTAPVALAYLGDVDGLVEAALALGVLTHVDPEAGDACVLWCLAIRQAVLTGCLDVRAGLDHLDPARRAVWAQRITAAEAARPADFVHNGWVVEAFQGAWSAIAGTERGPGRLARALEAAVRGGRDTDTVAAIAGGLLGALDGASAVPPRWRAALHGWPGRGDADLVALAGAIVQARP